MQLLSSLKLISGNDATPKYELTFLLMEKLRESETVAAYKEAKGSITEDSQKEPQTSDWMNRTQVQHQSGYVQKEEERGHAQS